jgi:high-affinity iron transporter
LFATTRRLNLRHFFQVTNVLLLFFAAGLVAYGVHELNEAAWIPPIIENVWDINHIISDKSEVGGILKVLFGYNGNPSLSEVLAYLGYFAVLGTILLRNQRKQVKTKAVAI